MGPDAMILVICYHSHFAKVLLKSLAQWMDLEIVILKEVGQTEKDTYHMISLMKVKVTQLCLTLCNPVDYTVCGILSARILEWVAIPSSRGSSPPRD